MYPSPTDNEPNVSKGFSSSSPTPLPLALPPRFSSTNNQLNHPGTSSTALGEQDPRLRSLVPWSSGLCDCFDDLSTCCLTCWCPCVTFGRIVEIVDRGSTSCGVSAMLYMLISLLVGCPCWYSCTYRSKLRGQYFLKENSCHDCFIHCFCEDCALCQEYRELKNRGFDMSIGWHGNMERRARGVLAAPIVQGGVPLAPIVQGGMSRS